ncbi:MULTISPECIES: hypothetical protein [unclassified Streptomyces]|uniref:hypothetical protein n=1 Tax=Streptomyces TaxID=1883 RepID=UPI0008237ADE|nr:MULTISPECIES: hypothetical protein [unclassified Streptomyces]AWN27929.1 hypothetical protein DKG71_18865 [Streptomyces sp. NEAU-S7GS2]MYT15604.1 hypothetical protein [Streptomyces sp. SID4951]SCK23076.1 hypothetical protein YWIDRAFT_05072 [Streptomyces sp. SceaMP-e96]
MSEPVHHTILLFDIERFGGRDDVEQTFLRRKLYDIVEDTLVSAGVEQTQQYREDRGDGLIALISSEISKAALLRTLLTTTPGLLHHYNRLAASSTQMRLRIVLASGEVAHDPREGVTGGLVGHDLNTACRLLDTAVLRRALQQRSDEDSVLCVSDPVYQGVVRHGHLGVRREEFHQVEVAVKEGALTAWLHGPLPAAEKNVAPAGAAEKPAVGAADATEKAPAAPGHGVTFNFFGGAPSIGGSMVAGDQHGVSGGQVTGDVHLGGGGDRR